MPFVTITPDLRIHYIDENPTGSRPVVLLHGLGANASSWALQIPPLVQAGFRVIVPDARGFGKSSYPDRSHTVENMAEDITCLLQYLGLPHAHIVGISMGGTVALQLGVGYAHFVDRLVLVNTFARLRPRSISGWAFMVWRFILVHTLGLEIQAKAVARRLFPYPGQERLRFELVEQVKQADPRAYRASMRALGRFNLLDQLDRIQAQTLVITGAEDNTVPPHVQQQLANGIPGARQVVIPNAGHGVSVDQPELFNHYVLDFLQPDSF